MAVYHIRTNGFMLPEHKATEFYRTADDFCKEFVLLRNLLIIEYPQTDVAGNPCHARADFLVFLSCPRGYYILMCEAPHKSHAYWKNKPAPFFFGKPAVIFQAPVCCQDKRICIFYSSNRLQIGRPALVREQKKRYFCRK